jgi:hypothetical protein
MHLYEFSYNFTDKVGNPCTLNMRAYASSWEEARINIYNSVDKLIWDNPRAGLEAISIIKNCKGYPTNCLK